MFHRRLLTAGLALLIGGGLAASIPGLAAVGQSSPPGSPDTLVSPAQIVSKGAAAVVSVQVLCQSNDFTSLSVSLNQKSGSSITSGSAYLGQVPCSGQIQTIQLPITAAPRPFGQGTAFGQLSFVDCGFQGCSTFIDARSITLRK
jgi:hypothetical protein